MRDADVVVAADAGPSVINELSIRSFNQRWIELIGDENDTCAAVRRLRHRQMYRRMKKAANAMHANPDLALRIEEHALDAQNAIAVKEHETRQPDRELRP